jgi:hypothetical protein
MFPQTTTLLAQTTLTTTGTSAALTMPLASSYRLMFEVQTVSGTTPTLVVIVATSFNGGATYDEILSTTTMNTSGGGQQLLVRPYLGIGDAATAQSMTLLGTGADLAAGVTNNGPINPQFIKLRWVLSGTTPSLALTVGLIAVPQDVSD